LKITVLGSGSGGNSIVVQHGKSSIMIDAGFKFDDMLQRLEKTNISANSIQALFVTHGHLDHTVGVADLSCHASIPVYLTEELFLWAAEPDRKGGALSNLNRNNVRFFALQDKLHIEGFEVMPIPVSHDSISPVGFVIEADGIKLSIVTDAGDIPGQSKDAMKDSNVIMLESSYDNDMLWNSKRTHFLKKRISGAQGHLSNEKSAETVSEILSGRTSDVVLLHLSQECNTPELARNAALEKNIQLKDGSVSLHVASQNEPLSFCIERCVKY